VAQAFEHAAHGVETEFDPEAPQPEHLFQASAVGVHFFVKKPGRAVPARRAWIGVMGRLSAAAVSIFARVCDSFSAQGFAHFSAPVLAWLLVAFFQLEPFEKTVVLNLFLQNAHRLLDVIVVDFDRYFLQKYRPLRPIEIGMFRWLFV
jgi:hypothetical protein